MHAAAPPETLYGPGATRREGAGIRALQQRCPYCHDDVDAADPAEPAVACDRCGSLHHAACFAEHGGCVVHACGGDGWEAASEALADALRPFVPMGAWGGGEAVPAFLAVAVEPDRRSARSDRPAVRLRVPPQASCGRPLEGAVEVVLAAPVRARGLRLLAEALARSRDGEAAVVRRQAVVAGAPPPGWLERLRVWEPPVRGLDLVPGRTRFRFTLDPGRWACGAGLPEDPVFGPWHVLRLRAVLDAPGARLSSRPCRVLVAHPCAAETA